MAKTELKKGKKLVKKSAIDSSSSPKIKKKKLITKKKKQPKLTSQSSDSESDSDPHTKIQTLLEPFPKEQLINLVADLCSSNTSLYSLIESAADADVSHRKLFVHGLGWDATKETVEAVFASFGKIEDINVVPDRATGKCKGYAFITYESRKSANNLLKNPKVTVGNRVVACQLASEGPVAPGTVSQKTFSTNSNLISTDFHQRKIYVNNVPFNANPGKLRSFFDKFGEIENGPTGLDPNTGKFRGYAIFVFKTVEGARKVLEEPTKVFDGNQLHCQQAAQGKSKGGNASITTAVQPVQPQMLAAVAAAQQNMALFGQQAGVANPLYGNFGNLGALMGGYYGMMGQGYGLGAYGAAAGANDGAGGSSGATPQGLQYMYPSSLNGQSSPLPKTSGAGGSGYFSGLWYDHHIFDK